MNNIILLTFVITILILPFQVTNKQVTNKSYFMEQFHKLDVLLKHVLLSQAVFSAIKHINH